LYPIAVAGSAVTTFTTPYLIRFSDPFCQWLEGAIPQAMKERLNRYQNSFSLQEEKGFLVKLWKGCGLLLVLNSVVIIGLNLAGKKWLLPMLSSSWSLWPGTAAITGLILFSVCLPFFRAIVRPLGQEGSGSDPTNSKSFQVGMAVVQWMLASTL